MPVNYLQIQGQIQEKCQQARQNQAVYRERLEQAAALLTRYAADLDFLRQRVEDAQRADVSLRCAVPLNERLDTAVSPPNLAQLPLLLAADGSQINPNRHDSVEFAVINTGIFRILPAADLTPGEEAETQLYLLEDINNPAAPLTEEVVALRRDLNERRLLADRAGRETTRPVITLTDGPLELYREPRENQLFQQLFGEYLSVLQKTSQQEAVSAGYVDKPGSDLVIRLLELAADSRLDVKETTRRRPLGGVLDRVIFAGLLAPGQRSAVFVIQSSMAERFAAFDPALQPCFFYLNVGIHPERAWMARVEITRGVAEKPALLEALHAVLLQQCRQMGSKPYPYALHRAHEIALITRLEKEQIETMIARAMRAMGLEVGDKSAKQYHKDNL
ncbi:DNA double-strand break repair nuclease NurA [Bellilinea sp.]|jgi:hypothetical protein|uniref:DNA double-strand break repair nuclease NurA n=1 Tax=Bellilinea sp. TaxID=2838785 RepID=UPI002ADE80CC|nr:DNA double-strand break repair nuclease NurA [Bellilinea sp.]